MRNSGFLQLSSAAMHLTTEPFLQQLSNSMRYLATSLLLCVTSMTNARDCPAVLNHVIPRLQDEKPQNLCQFVGRVIVVVNTASYCGFTPQYKGLETLYERYQARGLTVLGFPSNDFGSQEPAENQKIADFCESTFGVRFPMFVKSHVTPSSSQPNPLFTALIQRSGVSPEWNFHKYLIGRDGQTIRSFASNIDPQDRGFLQEVEKLLDAKN
jgi:glutathione peroxidase